MSRVYLTIPSARPPAEAEKVLSKWKQQGYGIALWRDFNECKLWPLGSADFCLTGETYPGYAVAVNRIIARVMETDPEADFFVAAGDDIEPDMSLTADEISGQCKAHFNTSPFIDSHHSASSTFGVMQPTGDRWGEVPNAPPGALQGSYSDRVAGSAWIGREFARRVNNGAGPFWPEFTHMFSDEHLKLVAEALGVYWMRRDLIQLHQHWARKRGQVTDMPEFLKKVNTKEHWDSSKAILERLKANGLADSLKLAE